MSTLDINGWTVDERGIVVNGTFAEKPPLGESPSHFCIEGVLLPRNPDGSLQYDEHTSIAPEAAEGLLQCLQEAEVDAIMADMEKLQERAVTEGYAAHDHPSFFIAPETKSELDMLQEGCPHHDPVD